MTIRHEAAISMAYIATSDGSKCAVVPTAVYDVESSSVSVPGRYLHVQ